MGTVKAKGKPSCGYALKNGEVQMSIWDSMYMCLNLSCFRKQHKDKTLETKPQCFIVATLQILGILS